MKRIVAVRFVIIQILFAGGDIVSFIFIFIKRMRSDQRNDMYLNYMCPLILSRTFIQ